jgi:hypothetical protein
MAEGWIPLGGNSNGWPAEEQGQKKSLVVPRPTKFNGTAGEDPSGVYREEVEENGVDP